MTQLNLPLWLLSASGEPASLRRSAQPFIDLSVPQPPTDAEMEAMARYFEGLEAAAEHRPHLSCTSPDHGMGTSLAAAAKVWGGRHE
jgi:hypothetical protein